MQSSYSSKYIFDQNINYNWFFGYPFNNRFKGNYKVILKMNTEDSKDVRGEGAKQLRKAQ